MLGTNVLVALNLSVIAILDALQGNLCGAAVSTCVLIDLFQYTVCLYTVSKCICSNKTIGICNKVHVNHKSWHNKEESLII